MIKILLYLKHNLAFVWTWIEALNSWLFRLRFRKRLKNVNQAVLAGGKDNADFKYTVLEKNDMPALAAFFAKQPEEYFRFFRPHGFDLKSLEKKNNDKAFIMIGAWQGTDLVGYGFLRCFFNGKSFRGKIVDMETQGRGIAKTLGVILTSIAASMHLRLFATISKENVKSIASSKAVNDIRIVEELPDGYLYVEYLPKRNEG